MEETRVGDTKKACAFSPGGRRAILHEAEQQRKGGVTEFERFLSFPPPPPPSFQPPARHSRRELRRERYSNSNSLALSLSRSDLRKFLRICQEKKGGNVFLDKVRYPVRPILVKCIV